MMTSEINESLLKTKCKPGFLFVMQEQAQIDANSNVIQKEAIF